MQAQGLVSSEGFEPSIPAQVTMLLLMTLALLFESSVIRKGRPVHKRVGHHVIVAL